MGSLKQWWYVFSANKSTLLGGILPIMILITILGSFSLLYKNSIKVLDHLFEISSYSLILKQGTSVKEVDEFFQKIKKNSHTINVKKVTPAQAKKDILEAFDKINKDLQSLELDRFPYVLEFNLKTNKTKPKKFLQELKENPATYSLVSGLDSSSHIETLFVVIHFMGGFFLLLLAISVFYIVNHSIQVIFFNLKKEIEVLLILGATQGFIYTPFMFNGILITSLGCLLGGLTTYVIFLSSIAFITFDESSFFIGQVVAFFKPDFLVQSFLTLALIGLLSSWSAIYNVIQKIEITA